MFKMEVYTPELELIGFLEVYKSAIFEEYAFKSGSFSVESILTAETVEMLKPENIIWFEGGTAGIIEYIEQTTDETGQYIIVKGSLLIGLLSRRILWGGYDFYNSPSKILADIVADCAITPTKGDTEKRKIPNLILGNIDTDTRKIRKSQTGGELLEFLTETGEATLTAFGVNFNAKELKMEFFTHIGVDRTINQVDNNPVFFSVELDDVLNADYTYSSMDFKNTALVAGEGEGTSRVFEQVEGTETGIARRELWIDARDLQKDNGETTYTDEEYSEVLTTRGQERLSENCISTSFSAEVRTVNPTYILGEDYFLGDTITVKDERLNITVDAVVTGYQKSNSIDGEQMTLYFGFGVPTIYDKLKRKVNK